MGISHYSSSLPRHERRRSSLVSYHEESHQHRKRRRSEDNAHSLKHLPRVVSGSGECYEDNFKCFSRDEVINFIDETPLPSPMKSPRRTSTISLIPDVYEHHVVLFPHFPLTDFEREPQALRRLSEHSRSGSRGGSPDGSPRRDRGEGSGACGTGKGCPEHRRSGKRHGELLPPGQTQRTGEPSSHRPSRTGHGAGPGAGAGAGAGSGWVDQKHQSKAERKGSTNSFISSPSASSSGYITFHSDSIGSTT